MKKGITYMLISTAFVLGCKKPYNPPVVSTDQSYLVVEGVINSGGDSTIIKLNRTVKLSAVTTVNPELNATLFVEGDDNTSYALIDQGKGVYVYPGLNLDNAHKYRLTIRTSAGKQYASDFVPVLNSTPIDDVVYHIETDGLSINVNTHDPKNSTRYYRWEYEETWMYNSEYNSAYKSNGDTVLQRDLVNDQISTCWISDASSTIILGSSAKLAQDVISDGPIIFISRHSAKLRRRYSILVRQYALTSGAYEFWDNVKKNTENLGSIFDAQPSQLKGNIHSLTNAAEPVIGYVSVGSYTLKRTYVDERVLPAWLDPDNKGCVLNNYLYHFTIPNSTIIVNQVDQYINFNKATLGPILPVQGIVPPGAPEPIGYTGSIPECVDCTLFGTNKQPSFWVN